MLFRSVIASAREEAVGEPFKMFDFSPVGLAVALLGLLYLAVLGWRFIPRDRQGKAEARDLFRIKAYITEARVPDGSALIGTTARRPPVQGGGGLRRAQASLWASTKA